MSLPTSKKRITRQVQGAKVGRSIGNTIVFSFLALFTVAGPAQSQTAFVIGGGLARDCYEAVKIGAPVRIAKPICDDALVGEAMMPQDRAATHVNRGIIALRQRDAPNALVDFDEALRISPDLGAAFLNRAGAYLLQRRWLEAEIDASTALQIGVRKDEWAAHFNRGVALEQLGNVPAAYGEFQKAAELAPSREEPRTELARFSVTSASTGKPAP